MSHWTSSILRLGRAGRAEQLDQADERGLRGVGPRVEHGLGGEQPADRDSVEPAGEALVVPRFDRVRPAALVELAVRRDDVVVDPALGLARPHASVDNRRERSVDANLVPPPRPSQRT